MQYVRIGSLENDSGADHYYEISIEEADKVYHLTDKQLLQFVFKAFQERSYIACKGAGTMFCDTVKVMPIIYRENRQFIGIAEVRRDVVY